jgi:hypothetical protein
VLGKKHLEMREIRSWFEDLVRPQLKGIAARHLRVTYRKFREYISSDRFDKVEVDEWAREFVRRINEVK